MRTGGPRREGRTAVSVLMFGLRAAEGVRARPRLSVRPLVYRGPGAFAAALINANPVSLGTRSTFDGLWNAREHPPSPASRV
jgi:hypothetical protein